jgi:uncharacterized protein YchJ
MHYFFIIIFIYLFYIYFYHCRWAKEVLKMSVDYDYYGIEIINSKISKNKEKASVLFRALYKEGNSLDCLISLFLEYRACVLYLHAYRE